MDCVPIQERKDCRPVMTSGLSKAQNARQIHGKASHKSAIDHEYQTKEAGKHSREDLLQCARPLTKYRAAIPYTKPPADGVRQQGGGAMGVAEITSRP